MRGAVVRLELEVPEGIEIVLLRFHDGTMQEIDLRENEETTTDATADAELLERVGKLERRILALEIELQGGPPA